MDETDRKSKIETVKSILGTTASAIIGFPTFYAVTHMNDSELADLVADARTDPVAFEFLRSWLGGDMPVEFPNPVPSPLIPFIQDLINGRIPPSGNILREIPRNVVLRCVTELREQHQCKIGEAIDIVAKAAGLKAGTIKKIYYRKGE